MWFLYTFKKKIYLYKLVNFNIFLFQNIKVLKLNNVFYKAKKLHNLIYQSKKKKWNIKKKKKKKCNM